MIYNSVDKVILQSNKIDHDDNLKYVVIILFSNPLKFINKFIIINKTWS